MNAPSLSAAEASRLTPENPWPGLVAFTAENCKFFYGREREIQDIFSRVSRQMLTVLFGVTGLGKTSLLQAGLLPQLGGTRFHPILIRLNHDIEANDLIEQLHAAVNREAAAATEAGIQVPHLLKDDEDLWGYLHDQTAGWRNSNDEPVLPVLIFDQFEEIFNCEWRTRDTDDRRERFIEFLACLAENRVPDALTDKLKSDAGLARRYDLRQSDYRVVISLREDFLADLEGFKWRMPSIMENRMRLLPLSTQAAKECIERPAPGLIDSEAAARLVDFLAGAETSMALSAAGDTALYARTVRREGHLVEPALLSIVCRELNLERQRQGMSRITADFANLTQEQVLADFYERCWNGLPQQLRCFVEDELLTPAGNRTSRAEDEAIAHEGITRTDIRELVDRRLLRYQDHHEGARRIELTHDLLCRVVRASRRRREEEKKQRLATEAQRRAEEEARETAKRLADAEAARAQEERRRQEAERMTLVAATARRRARLFAATTGIVAILALGAFFWARMEKNEALAAKHSALDLVNSMESNLKDQLMALGFLNIANNIGTNINNYYENNPPQSDDDLAANSLWLDLYCVMLQQEGQLQTALRASTNSLAVRKFLADKHPENFQMQDDLSQSYDHLGDIYEAWGDLDSALTNHMLCLRIKQQLVAQDTNNTAWRGEFAESLDHLGIIYGKLKDLNHSMIASRQSLEIRLDLVNQDTNDSQSLDNLSESYDHIGDAYEAQGNLKLALTNHIICLAIKQKLASRYMNREWQSELAQSEDDLGEIYEKSTNYDSASNCLWHAFSIRQTLVYSDGKNAEWQDDLSESYDHCGDICKDVADFDQTNDMLDAAATNLDQALAYHERCLEMKEALKKLDPDNYDWQKECSHSYDDVSDILLDQAQLQIRRGNLTAANADYQKALANYNFSLDIDKHLVSVDPSNTIWLADLIESSNQVDETLKALESLTNQGRLAR